jgi:hypothetical protein
LAAFEAQACHSPYRRLALVSAAAALVAVFVLARPVYVARGLDFAFVQRAFESELGPLLLLAVAAAAARRRPVLAADAVLVCLVLQRFLEMGGTYPTLPAASLAPPLPTLAALWEVAARIVARARYFPMVRALRARGRSGLRVARARPVRRYVPACAAQPLHSTATT